LYQRATGLYATHATTLCHKFFTSLEVENCRKMGNDKGKEMPTVE